MPSDTATTAAADSTATFSHQEERAYPPPSCSAFHGRSGSSECAVTMCGTPYRRAARWPALLPRAERLKRMRGDDVRHAVQEGSQVARQVGVPGVRVHQVGGADSSGHRQIGGDRLQGLVRPIEQFPGLVRDGASPVRALAVHRQVDEAAEFPGQIGDMHSGAAVHLRRVLARQQRDPQPALRTSHHGAGHHSHAVTTWLLPTTVIPSSDTAKPRSRSCSLSTPMTTPSGKSTCLSRMAVSITAWRPMMVLFRITARSTRAQLFTRTPGESTASRTRPPEMMTPLLTRLSMARPTRLPESCTNLAGGCDATRVRIGHLSL